MLHKLTSITCFICSAVCFVGNVPTNVSTRQGSGGTASFGSVGAEALPGPPEAVENDPALGKIHEKIILHA